MQMPKVLVLAYLEMLPRLTAQDQLDAIYVARAGQSATIPIDELKGIEKDLTRAANPQAKRPRAKQATPDQLAAMGLGFVTVPPAETTD